MVSCPRQIIPPKHQELHVHSTIRHSNAESCSNQLSLCKPGSLEARVVYIAWAEDFPAIAQTWSSRCPCLRQGVGTRSSIRSFQPKPFDSMFQNRYTGLWSGFPYTVVQLWAATSQVYRSHDPLQHQESLGLGYSHSTHDQCVTLVFIQSSLSKK